MKKICFILILLLFFCGVCFGGDVQQATGAGAMSETYTKNKNGKKLIEVRLHLNQAAATSENFVVYIDSSVSSVYDTVLFSQDMSGVQDVVFRPTFPISFGGSGDVIRFTYTNSDSKTWGLEGLYQ